MYWILEAVSDFQLYLNKDGNAFPWEGKHLVPVFQVQIRSCLVEVKGGSNFLTWHIWWGSTASVRTVTELVSIF